MIIYSVCELYLTSGLGYWPSDVIDIKYLERGGGGRSGGGGVVVIVMLR